MDCTECKHFASQIRNELVECVCQWHDTELIDFGHGFIEKVDNKYKVVEDCKGFDPK